MLRACLLLSAALATLAPRLADACSPPICEGGTITPGDVRTVPANLPGLVWTPLVDHSTADRTPDASKLTLTRSGDATPLPFTVRALDTVRMLVVPDAPLAAGTTYEIDDATACTSGGGSFRHSRFSVRPATPAPTTLGTLAASEQLIGRLTVETFTGACVADVEAAQRTIHLAMDPVADEWLELLQFQVFVDDRLASFDAHKAPGPPGTHQSGASVQVHRTCLASDSGADPGLAAGTHTIRLEARLPGSTAVVSSDTLTFDLSCEGHGKDEPPPEDGGCNASGASSLGCVGLALAALVLRRRRPA